MIDPEESLIDDSPLNNDEHQLEQGSLIDDSPLNDEKKDDNESPATILPPPD